MRMPAYRSFDPSKLNGAQQAELSRHVWHGAGLHFWNTQDGAIAVAASMGWAAGAQAQPSTPRSTG